MDHNDKRIDDLLRRNTDQQLAGFDWDHLHADISGQLDRARPRQRRVSVFKIAVADAATAALLFISVLVRNGVRPDAPPPDKPPTARSTVKLVSTTAKCSVTMIDANGSPKEETDKSRRISIIRTHPRQADTTPDRDSADFACLL